jgi:hypothetical protein
MARIPKAVSEAAAAMAKRRARLMTPEQRQEQGRLGGSIGGPARAKKLSKAERKDIAQKAAEARWGKMKKPKGTNP